MMSEGCKARRRKPRRVIFKNSEAVVDLYIYEIYMCVCVVILVSLYVLIISKHIHTHAHTHICVCVSQKGMNGKEYLHLAKDVLVLRQKYV